MRPGRNRNKKWNAQPSLRLGIFICRGRHPGTPVNLFVNAASQRHCSLLFFVGGHCCATMMSAGDNKASETINTADPRDPKCNRPNAVGKDEVY